MMRQMRTVSASLLLLCSYCVGLAPHLQAADPATGIPDSASVVVRLKAPQATFAKLGNYVNVVQPGFGSFVTGALPALGDVIKCHNLAGVDVENDWWVVVFAYAEDQPSLVFVIPATDLEAVENGLPEGFEFHKSGNLAVFSDDEEALGKVREQLDGKGTSLWAAADPASKKLFDSSDLSVMVNVTQLAEEFENEIEQAEPRLNDFIDMVSNTIPEAQRAQVNVGFDMYRQLGRVLIAAVKDSKSYTLGILVSKEAIRIDSALQVKPETGTSTYLAQQATSDQAMVNQLPAGKSIYFGIKGDNKKMAEWGMQFSKNALPTLTDKQKADLDMMIKQMSTVEFGGIAGYMDLDSKLGNALRMGAVSEVTPTDRIREIARSTAKTFAEIDTPQFKQTTTLQPAALKIAGFEVDRTIINQVPKEDPMGLQKKIRDACFTEAGMEQLTIYQPKRVIQVMGGAKDMESLVAAFGATPAKTATTTPKAATTGVLAATRKHFAEQANVVTFTDVPRLIVNGAKLAMQSKAIPDFSKTLDSLKLTPSFMGFALTCEPTAMRTQFEIPVEQAQGIAQVVMVLVTAMK